MNDRFIVEFWSKELKRFISLDSQGLYVNFSNGHIYTRDGSMNVTDRYIRRQSTGLRDKNGKLIFEGDILRTVVKTNWSRSSKNKNILVQVVYIDDGFYPKKITKTPKSYRYYDADLSNMEKVGNIHENPELLEAE